MIQERDHCSERPALYVSRSRWTGKTEIAPPMVARAIALRGWSPTGANALMNGLVNIGTRLPGRRVYNGRVVMSSGNPGASRVSMDTDVMKRCRE